MTTEAMRAAEFNDAELVAESLGGNREAFRQIVERYQTLISSLAYCATGNVSQSEDLAQETFVSAWKQLADLREPARLRPWLCSITRFLISKEFRRQGREPVHAAESLEAVDEWVSPEPLPPDQVISEEEKVILWRSLERIPEIYREPLVLFYREHQSIEAVAKDLGLSEDAVKQRLSRGRKLLQEQFLAFVAGALKQTAPDKNLHARRNCGPAAAGHHCQGGGGDRRRDQGRLGRQDRNRSRNVERVPDRWRGDTFLPVRCLRVLWPLGRTQDGTRQPAIPVGTQTPYPILAHAGHRLLSVRSASMLVPHSMIHFSPLAFLPRGRGR